MAEEISHLTPEGRRYFAELKKLADMEIRVGFQAGEAEEENGTDIVDIAAYNEYGSSDTPARPFMKQSFENHEDELQAVCDEAMKMIKKGGTAQQALNKIGVLCKALVQSEIRDGNFVPNAPSTIKKKGSDKPLIDTGTMRQSVQYVIEKRK